MAQADIPRWWSAQGIEAPSEWAIANALGMLARAGRIAIVGDCITRIEPS